MFNEIEKRSMYGMLVQQNVVTEEMFYTAYKNREQGNAFADVSAAGERIIGIVHNNRAWYLQSRYNSALAAEVWAEQYREDVTDDTVFLVFGMGDGTYLESLAKLNANAMIIVYEPCQEVFWAMFGEERIAQLLESGHVSILVEGINEQLIGEYLGSMLNYANFQLVKTCIVPNYDKLFLERYKWMLDKYLYCVTCMTLDRNTELRFKGEVIKNILGLSKDIAEHSSIVQLSGIVGKQCMEEMPAILVAAGPSLDNNIDKLIEMQDSAFIFAVDTALNTVIQHGILPDMTMSVDGHKPLKLFMNEKVKDIPIALSPTSNKEILSYVGNKRFYELSPETYLGVYYEQLGKKVQALPTGGSVANNALSLLRLMGFKTIIFMGQDLAYPEGKTHTIEAYNQEKIIDINSKKYVKVKDIHGNDVYTEPNMRCYLQWFEKYISLCPDIKFIDATEGGARIQGTDLWTMDEVIRVYGEHHFDKSLLLDGINAYLSEEEQKEMKAKICHMEEEIEDIEALVKKGLRAYDKLEQMNRKHATSKAMSKVIDQIMEYNDCLEKKALFHLVKQYAIVIDYAVKGSVLLYNRKDDIYSQIEDIVRQGRKLLEGYQMAIREMKPDLEELVKDFR